LILPGARLAALAILVAGCSDGPVVEEARLSQPSPDSLVVAASFASSDGLFGRDLAPDSVFATAMDARSRVLGRAARSDGGPLRIGIPDARLGAHERISVEVCGRVQGETVCEQLGARASAKRYRAVLDVDYPLGGNRDRLGYEVTWTAERRLPDSTWRPLELAAPPQATLSLAPLEQPDTRVTVPLPGTRGQIGLIEADGHSDFWFALRDALRQANATRVRATLALADGTPVASDTLTVRELSDRERYAVAASYARVAVGQVLARLAAPDDGRVSWRMVGTRFDALQSRYVTTVTLDWRGGNIFDRDHYAADVRIEHAEDGASASATLLDATDDLRDVWEGRVGGRTIRLGTLIRGEPSEALDDPAPVRSDYRNRFEREFR
jgi:hypothetical protein